MRAGADLIGGCPYADAHPVEHVDRIFAIARRFDLDIDFHLDFDLDPSTMRCAKCAGRRARTATAAAWPSATSPSSRSYRAAADRMAREIADAGVAVTVLPATDLFLMGRGHDHDVPRGVTPRRCARPHGVTCSIATNNVLNAFTPFGDCSLVRIANLYANVAQLGRYLRPCRGRGRSAR